MKLPIAILAGGLATRLRPMTERIPKSLIEVGAKPFVIRQLELLAHEGFGRVVLCLGHLGELVRQAVGDGSRWDLEVCYSFDGDRLLGTGGALRKARPLLGEAFFVMYGDSYLDCDFGAVEGAFLASRVSGLMTVFRNDNRWDRSNVVYRGGRIITYDKKNQTPEMSHIDYGLGVLRAKVLEAYPDEAPFDLATIYQDLLARGELGAFEVTRRFHEIGSPAGLEEARRYFEDKERTT